jgi:thioester reductase-like protein
MADRSNLKIAMTGATGFLGSYLMASMLSAGHSIIVFGRSAKEEALKERICRLLRWFGIENLFDQVTCVNTDLSKDNLGLADEEYFRLRSTVNSVIHCASNTSFSENKLDMVMAANIGNLDGILNFAKNATVKSFNYISTAYVAGLSIETCKEILPSAKLFTNVYEESKAGG